MTLAARIGRGMVAGVLGGAAMDLVRYVRSTDGDGGPKDLLEYEFGGDPDDMQEAGAPAEVAAMAADQVGVDLPDDAALATRTAMHWATAVGYGVLGALLPGPDSTLARGAVIGLGAFGSSYAVLGALGLYEPIWEYEPATLAQDASVHLVYGLVAATTLDLLTGDGSA